MSAPIIYRLLRSRQTLVMLAAMGTISFGLAFMVYGMRTICRRIVASLLGDAEPIGFSGFLVDWLAAEASLEVVNTAFLGTIAFLVAGIVAAAAAVRVHGLRACPFSAQLPGLERRVLRELVTLEAMLVALALAVGAAAGHGAFAALPAMALLGFGVGVLSHDPRQGAPRPWEQLPVLLAFLPLFFAPEIARVAAFAPLILLIAAAACGGLMLMGSSTYAGLRRRFAPRPQQALWLGEGWDIRDGSIADPRGSWFAGSWRCAGRRGERAFPAFRRSDWQWSQAMLQEIYGLTRLGWMGNIALMAGALLVVLSIAAAFLVAPILDRAESTTDAEWQRAIAQALAEPGQSSRLLATALLARILSIFLYGVPMRTPLAALYPISRTRRARVTWLVTQAQEWWIVLCGWAFLLAVGAMLWGLGAWRRGVELEVPALLSMGAADLWRVWSPCLLAVFIATPLARWGRLMAVDARQRGTGSPLGGPGDVAGLLGIMVPLAVVATGLQALWMIASSQAVPVRWLAAVLTVAALFGLRWWWLAVLQRFHARCDLAA